MINNNNNNHRVPCVRSYFRCGWMAVQEGKATRDTACGRGRAGVCSLLVSHSGTDRYELVTKYSAGN